MRRKDFDRSPFVVELTAGILVEHHLSLASGNPQFKAHQSLINT